MGRGAWQATVHGVEKSQTRRIEALCAVLSHSVIVGGFTI